jgi:RNA polymerase sigma-70 factor (ECF subfamily)
VDLAELDDAALVVRTQAGDRSAFEQLVRRTGRLLFSRLYLETGDAHLAEDLVQEAYLVVWRSIDQVTEPAGFRSWLFSVAHSVRIDAARRGKRKKRSGGAASVGEVAVLLAGVPDAAPSPDESLEAEEQRRRVVGMLKSMPEEYREVITLRYLGGADYETIGRQLGLSNGSLRGLLNRGMAKLREMAKEMLNAER